MKISGTENYTKTEIMLLKQAYKELEQSAKRGFFVELTPAQLKRRRLLIAHEKNQRIQPEETTQKELFE